MSKTAWEIKKIIPTEQSTTTEQPMTAAQAKKAEQNRKYREKLKAKKGGITEPTADETDTSLESFLEPSEAPVAAEKPKKGKKGTKAPAKPKKEKKAPKPAAVKKVSALDAAYEILKDSEEALTPKQLIEEMSIRKLWRSPGGKTPEATMSAAIIREIGKKGNQSRFRKTAPGHFAASK